MWSLDRVRLGKNGKWTYERTVNPLTHSPSKDGEFSEDQCSKLTSDCIRSTKTLGREKVKRIVQYVREQHKLGPSPSDNDSEAPRSSGALKFDFSQLMDTSA